MDETIRMERSPKILSARTENQQEVHFVQLWLVSLRLPKLIF